MSKKKLCFLILLISIFCYNISWSQSNVFISELCDPQSDYANDRFIEIYNAGNTQVDLTGWTIVAIGNTNDIFMWNLSGNIQPNEALVAGNITTVDNFNVNFADDSWMSSNGSWNGKNGDGAKLLNASGNIVDYIEVPSSTFENKDLVRNPDILVGNINYDNSEWTSTSVSTPTEGSPGSHIIDQQVENPDINNISVTPSTPISGDLINISATIVDTITTIANVELNWGTSISNLNNTITLSIDSGNEYTTDTPIPSQTGGNTIYYNISATNANGDNTTTAIFEIYMPPSLSISQIQGGNQSNYTNQEIVTSGIVTSVYNNYFTIQDGTGAKDGIWIASSFIPAIGDSVQIKGEVSENVDNFVSTTFLTQIEIIDQTSPNSTFDPVNINISQILANDDYEGMTVKLNNVSCSSIENGIWTVNDNDNIKIGNLGVIPELILGTNYDITGAIIEINGEDYIQPQSQNDISWVSDNFAPLINNVTILNANQLEIEFSEELNATSVLNENNFQITDQVVIGSSLSINPSRVILDINTLSEGDHTLSVNQIEDIYGNSILNETYSFNFIASNYPTGYYNPAIGLEGQSLRQALHDIIDDHTVKSYDYAWTAYYTTDAKPNGKVWDIYSDTPEQQPPYEYDFGVDEGGIGGGEGNGYTREHSWPKSWYGGTVTPMYSDIFALYPCDAHVNGNRGNYPYGEVSTPEWTSLNGSKRGSCSYPGYNGTVFEPIDEFKGDLARTYFYMSTRYYGEDQNWPGSDMANGAELEPWAVNMLLEWHANDPVSQKEIIRNNAIYVIQQNRNPYIDHPEWVECIWGNECNLSLENLKKDSFILFPNPTNDILYIQNTHETSVESIQIYDQSGRCVYKNDQIIKNQIKVSQFEKGIYFLQLNSQKKHYIKKFIVK